MFVDRLEGNYVLIVRRGQRGGPYQNLDILYRPKGPRNRSGEELKETLTGNFTVEELLKRIRSY